MGIHVLHSNGNHKTNSSQIITWVTSKAHTIGIVLTCKKSSKIFRILSFEEKHCQICI